MTIALVSVVIPTKDRAVLLERALLSVFAQTYPVLEIIVVDDGSSDSTPEVVRKYGNKNVQYIRHEYSEGGARARNAGILAAQGSYIAFLDDDDEWEPEKIREQLRLATRFSVVLCGFHGEEHGPAKRYRMLPTIGQDELRRGFFRGGGTSALFAHTAVLREFMFDDALPRCQDWDLCIRIAKRYEIGYVARSLVRYNDGDHMRISNSIHNMPRASIEQQLLMLHKHKNFFGPRLYRFHMCRVLLRSVSQRPDRFRFLLGIVKRYGMVAVLEALMNRICLKMMYSRMASYF